MEFAEPLLRGGTRTIHDEGLDPRPVALDGGGPLGRRPKRKRRWALLQSRRAEYTSAENQAVEGHREPLLCQIASGHLPAAPTSGPRSSEAQFAAGRRLLREFERPSDLARDVILREDTLERLRALE